MPLFNLKKGIFNISNSIHYDRAEANKMLSPAGTAGPTYGGGVLCPLLW